jgi:3-deoxy-7-phosphoheptulonate synthase
MILTMNMPTREQINRVAEKIIKYGLEPHQINDKDKVIFSLSGEIPAEVADQLKRMDGVDRVFVTKVPFKLASREFNPQGSIVRVGNVEFGGGAVVIVAGPCAVESYEQVKQTALAVKGAGAAMLRGGAYKPRTSPYAFQGLEAEGLRILKAVKTETGLPVVSEVTDPRAVELVAEHVDMLQVGARNMQNYVLLKEAAQAHLPVLLKRGISATVEEWLMSAEYLLTGGNSNVVLCERGIRTFETYTRNTFDINAVPLAKQLSHLPVIADPSHGTGSWKLVNPVAKAALAAGADGLIIEVHDCPAEALSDGVQSLTFANFEQLMRDLAKLTPALGRKLSINK